MGSKRKRRRRSDSSCPSSTDETSSEATTPPRRSTAESQRNPRKKEDKLIKRILEEFKDVHEQLKELTKSNDKLTESHNKLTESHYKLSKQLDLHINGSSGDDSAASRCCLLPSLVFTTMPRVSESNQVQPPRYRLELTCDIDGSIEKGQIINKISVAIKDDHNRTVDTEPLASSRVKLVVVKGEFDQHDNRNWSRKDFESNIIKPRKGNSVMGDTNQSTESIVKNCYFNLVNGVQSHGDATIMYNSSNKKVRLAVMTVSPTGERVLEGLSDTFYVRGHDRKRREVPLQLPGNTTMPSTEPSTSAWTQQGQNSHLVMYRTSMPQLHAGGEQSALHSGLVDLNSALYNNTTGGEQPVLLSGLMDPNSAPHNNSMGGEQSALLRGLMDPNLALCNSTGNDYLPITNGTEINTNYIVRPVQLVWDSPIVEQRKSWNLLDQLMPLYSCQPKFNNCGLPPMHLMTERLGSLIAVTRDAMQTRQKRSVLIEPLEPDDSDEDGSLKRRLHRKYQLRFVNKVCEAYYTMERIKADDGNLLKVALFDENNTKITTGPLSSASLKVVVLHGDFNADGQDCWTSEDFSRCVVCPQPGKAEAVLGGGRILILADGEACLHDAFFKITSFDARTGRFKMGVRLAGAQDVRIQEGISEPFRVIERPCKRTSWRSPANDAKPEAEKTLENLNTKFIPVIRSGGWADIGSRKSMEDVYICCDNFMKDFGLGSSGEGPSAFYGVFDGHDGKHAADFVCSNLPRFIVEDEGFPGEIEKAVSSAFLRTDAAFADACSLNRSLASGTTAIAALVVGRSLLVANAGDCRAVLCRRRKAIDMSRDHRPSCKMERTRIEASGGYVDDGYLNGQLGVTRAIGDWHIEGMKECDGHGPLSAEPEVMTMDLTEDDEFLIIACDGIWDVFSSQTAVDFARRKLQEHNDPTACCKELVDEAIKRGSSDNLSVVVVCFNSMPPPVLSRSRVNRSISVEGLMQLKILLGG
ncbi:hypothetical protein ACP70R_008604 [Stipagrostis hirtigluma subsp. patula]